MDSLTVCGTINRQDFFRVREMKKTKIMNYSRSTRIAGISIVIVLISQAGADLSLSDR